MNRIIIRQCQVEKARLTHMCGRQTNNLLNKKREQGAQNEQEYKKNRVMQERKKRKIDGDTYDSKTLQ